VKEAAARLHAIGIVEKRDVGGARLDESLYASAAALGPTKELRALTLRCGLLCHERVEVGLTPQARPLDRGVGGRTQLDARPTLRDVRARLHDRHRLFADLLQIPRRAH
jgi:hypothetical protein